MGSGVGAEGRHEGVGVVGAGGEHDVAGLDAFQWDRGEVRAQGVDVAGEGHGLPGRDEFDHVLESFDEGAVRGRASVGAGVDAPEGARKRVGPRTFGISSSAMSSRGTDSLPASRWPNDTTSTRGSS
ncbi:hypothetical protein GCM10009753_76070 [Streptantibioticus ferralitis]